VIVERDWSAFDCLYSEEVLDISVHISRASSERF